MYQYQEKPKWYLRITYFLIANQIFLRRLVIFILLFGNILIWAGTIIKWTNYVSTIKAHNYMVSLSTQNFVDFEDYRANHKPKLPIISQTAAILSENGTYDFVAKVENPNQDWAIKKIRYRFVYPSGITSERQDFIMPASQKYLFAFLEETTGQPDKPELEVLEITWQRIKSQSRVEIIKGFEIKEDNFFRLADSSHVDFKITNLTPFSFWNIGLQIVLYQGSNIIAANYGVLTNFMSLEEKEAQVSWFKSLPTPSKIDIIADIDVLESNIFIRHNVGPGVPKGYD